MVKYGADPCRVFGTGRQRKGVKPMSNQVTSRKSLWMALLVAVMVLTVALCFAGCNNEQADVQTTAPATTVGTGEAERVDLYWNLDRALYDGMSEAGMSSREPGEDGYFHVRFFKDGEIVELRVADRKTINAMEVQDLMGLEFDEDGLVVGIIPVDDLPIEKLAWQFYVQSVGGKLIKTNSSASLNGMEILLETDENTGIWDMTGLSGDIGCEADAMQLDRIMALGDADGNVTHIFIYERPNYMKTHEGECEHCEKTVTWYEWTKTDSLPINGGHYQLMNDLSGVRQASMVEDAKICLDLNGHRVDGASGARIYSLHNAGTELAIMDTSEAKTGRIAAHGKGDQGMCVWLRYGVFYLYDGILDGSDATTTLNGPTVNMGSNTYFYMYGGELIGGTAAVKSNGKGGWTGGVGGTLFIGANAKFVMYDGLIHGGRAKAAITKYTADGKPNGYSCGVGGNIYANTGAVIELNGGVIRDGIGEAHTGNIYLGGKVELTINDTLISNGRALGRTTNGGNLFVSSTASVVMNGGTIRNGRVYNCAGNVYSNGRFQMNDGIITDGKVIDWNTKAVKDTAAHRNVYSVQGDFYMYGGRIAGGFAAIDTDAKSNPTIVLVSARSVIFDEDGTGPHLSLLTYNGGGNCVMYVGPMHDEGKVGVSSVQTAVFTQPTKVENTDNFISDIEGADIGWTEQGLAIGKIHCLCSQDPEIGDDEHKLGCDKIMYAWTPWTKTDSLPTTAGYWYLTKDVTIGKSQEIITNGSAVTHVALDMNGKTVTNKAGRMYSLFENPKTYLEDGKTIAPDIEGEAIHLTLTDTVGTATVTLSARADADQGQLIWGRWNDSKVDILGGTYNCTEVTSLRHNGVVISAAGELNIYGGTFNGGNSVCGGIISGNNVNIYGGTISGGTAKNGGNIYSKGKVNIYGGTVTGGLATATENGYAQGGNIWMSGGSAVLTISGENTVISDGSVVSIVSGKSAWAPGGNVYANGGATVIVKDGATVIGGKGSEGHNLYLTGEKSVMELYESTIHNTVGTGTQQITIEGGTLTVDGATITNENANSRNIATNNSGTNKGTIIIKSGTISGGCRTNDNGGNILIGHNDTLTISGGTITGGRTNDSGGNIACYGVLNISGGLITDGVAEKNATSYNISVLRTAAESLGTLNLTGGTIAGGLQLNNYFDWVEVNVSGNPVVDKSLATANKPATSLSLASKDLNVGTMTSGAKIYVSGTEGVFTNPVSASYVNYFISEVEGSSVMHTDDGLFLGKAMCACGGKAVGVGDHVCKDVLWTAWTSDSTLPTTTGNYYLTKNVTSSGVSFKNEGTINIDLNGFDYIQNGGDRAFRMRDDDNKYDSAYTLTVGLTDSKGGGEVKVTHTGAQDGTIVWATESKHTFNLYAGILDASGVTTVSGKNGTAVKIDAASKFNMYGGEIKGGYSPSAAGGAIAVYGTSTFNMYKGTVSGGRSGNGGGNFVVFSKLNVFGGTITGGEGIHETNHSKKGGNISIQNGAEVRISGGTISNGVTDDAGGNIHVLKGGKLYVSGGTITGGFRRLNGTDSYSNNTNLFSVNGYVEISGGTINGFASTNTEANGCTVKISGNPVIGTNPAGSGGLYLAGVDVARPVLEVGTMTSGASVVLSCGGVISNVTDEANAKYFTTNVADSTVAWIGDAEAMGADAADEGKIYVGHVHCACGGALAGAAGHTCQPVIYKALTWNSGTYVRDLASDQNLYLASDVTMQNQIWTAGHDLNLCLNGHTLTNKAGARMIGVTNGSTFNLTTCDASYTLGQTNGNMLKATGNGVSNGGCIWVTSTGSIANLYRGTINASAYTLKPSVTDSSTSQKVEGRHGAAVDLATGTINMYDATIIGGKTGSVAGTYKNGSKAAYREASHGGSLRVNSGCTFNMYGGVIKDGSCSWGVKVDGTRRNDGWGGNVYMFGTFNLYAGTVTNGAQLKEDGSRNTGWTGSNFSIRGGGVLNVYGGQIDGAVAGIQAGTDATAKAVPALNVYNDAVVWKSDTFNNAFINGQLAVTIGENGENAKVGIVVNNESIVGTAVMTWEANASPNFANLPVLIYLDNSANRTFELVLESGKIYLRETTPVAP